MSKDLQEARRTGTLQGGTMIMDMSPVQGGPLCLRQSPLGSGLEYGFLVRMSDECECGGGGGAGACSRDKLVS